MRFVAIQAAYLLPNLCLAAGVKLRQKDFTNQDKCVEWRNTVPVLMLAAEKPCLHLPTRGLPLLLWGGDIGDHMRGSLLLKAKLVCDSLQ
jgi:hypothetical protein